MALALLAEGGVTKAWLGESLGEAFPSSDWAYTQPALVPMPLGGGECSLGTYGAAVFTSSSAIQQWNYAPLPICLLSMHKFDHSYYKNPRWEFVTTS